VVKCYGCLLGLSNGGCIFWVVLLGSCCFLAWLLFTPARDASTLSPVDNCFQSRLFSASNRRRCPCFVVGFHRRLVWLWVAACFLARWFDDVAFVSFDGLWVYSPWLFLRNAMVMFAACLGDFNLVLLLLCLLNRGVVRVVVVVVMRSGGGVEVWWWWRFSKRGGWYCLGLVFLGEEVGAFVVVVVGDSFWRPPLLFGSISIVATSCLSFG